MNRLTLTHHIESYRTYTNSSGEFNPSLKFRMYGIPAVPTSLVSTYHSSSSDQLRLLGVIGADTPW